MALLPGRLGRFRLQPVPLLRRPAERPARRPSVCRVPRRRGSRPAAAGELDRDRGPSQRARTGRHQLGRAVRRPVRKPPRRLTSVEGQRPGAELRRERRLLRPPAASAGRRARPRLPGARDRGLALREAGARQLNRLRALLDARPHRADLRPEADGEPGRRGKSLRGRLRLRPPGAGLDRLSRAPARRLRRADGLVRAAPLAAGPAFGHGRHRPGRAGTLRVAAVAQPRGRGWASGTQNSVPDRRRHDESCAAAAP